MKRLFLLLFLFNSFISLSQIDDITTKQKKLVTFDWLQNTTFNPLQLTNLQWAIEANNGVTTQENNTSCDSWHDLSNNHFNGIALTTGGHVRAVYLPTGINGLPSIDFNTSDFTYQSTWGAKFSKVNAFTLCGIIEINSLATATQGILTSSIANDNRFQISITGTNNLNFAYFNGASWIGHQVTGITTGIYYFIFQQQPGIMDPILWLNGTNRTTPGFASNGSVAANGIYVIGSVRSTSTVSQFDGEIRSLYLYSDIKDSETVNNLNAFLSNNAPGQIYSPRIPGVFALAGQSNASGNNSGGAPTVINGYQFYNISPVTNYLSLPMSCAQAFANRTYQLQNELTPFVILQSASGASVTNLTVNNWSATGALRGNLKTDLDAAKTYLNKTDVTGMLWSQGEADASFIVAGSLDSIGYQNGIQSLINWWQTNYPTAPFYFIRTGIDTSVGNLPGWITVRNVQQLMCEINSNVFMGYTETINFPAFGWMFDTIHYNITGQNNIGETLAEFRYLNNH